MSDDQAKEEAFLNEHYGGGLTGFSPEMIHEAVQEAHQPPEVVNDIHTSTSDPAAGGWTGADTAQVVHDVGMGAGILDADPMAIAELAAQGTQAVMDPHGQEVEKRLGEYGGTLPDGGLPGSGGSE